MVIIPYKELAPETLTALIESFIMREGTDYGWEEVSLDTKVSQVRRQVEKGEVVIVFDSASESVSLLTRQEAALLSSHE